MGSAMDYPLQVIGYVRSDLKRREDAPRQGEEGAPAAWLEIAEPYLACARDLKPGDEIIVLTWLHQGSREELTTHPRNDTSLPRLGVFSTRSPDRPNPIGLHPVTILEVAAPGSIRVEPLEAIDGTPVIDIKPDL
jgi:tRNA-Thr(GGU) m(6)t(6)A37 methyltransferase TsaA